HRQHDKALSDRGGIQGQRELLAVPAFYHPGQPRCPAGAEIELAAPGSRLGRRFAVQIAKPLAQGIELLLQDRRPRPSHGGQRARPSHDHAEAPQSQARGHRLAQMGKPLGDDIVPLVKSREAGHGSSPVSGNACHTSAYQNRASPFCCPEPRNLHLKGRGVRGEGDGSSTTSPPHHPTGRKVGGIDFGFRNPFAAVWGVLDRDGILWLTGEHYQSQRPLTHHAQNLPKDVRWYADPSGATEIAELRCAGFHISAGDNALRPGIAAVTARLETDRLRICPGCCPNPLREASLYRYSEDPTDRRSETPVDEHNHALAALRYLVSAIDARQMARLNGKTEAGEASAEDTAKARKP